MTRLARLFFDVVEDGVGLFDLLLGFGLDDLAQPKAHPIEDDGHGTRRGPLVRALALLSERLQGRLSRQPRVGQTRTKRRVLLRMGVGELTQRFSDLRMPLFPAFAPTEGRLRTETHDASASLGQAQRYRLASPTNKGFRHQGGARTIFQRHFSLTSASCGPSQFRGREA